MTTRPDYFGHRDFRGHHLLVHRDLVLASLRAVLARRPA